MMQRSGGRATRRKIASAMIADGLPTTASTSVSVHASMAAMIAAVRAAAGDDVLAIGAGNYGGKLGKFHFHLRQVVA